MKTIRVAVAGLAGHSENLQRALSRVPDFDYALGFDPDPVAAGKAAEQFGCATVPDFDALLKESEAVVIVSPNPFHAQQIEAALGAGVHVFVEKPITRTVADGVPLVRRARSLGLVLQVGHNTRFWPSSRMAKEVLKQGVLGEIVAFDGHFSHAGGLSSTVPEWKADPQRCPLLPMTQLGIHTIDTLHYLLDDTCASVTCQTNHAAMTTKTADTVVSTVKLTSGLVGTIAAHYVTPAFNEIRIFGTRGRMTVTVDEGVRVFVSRDEGPTETFYPRPAGLASFLAEFTQFARAIRGEEAPEVDGIQGLHALAAVEAMETAVREGRTVGVAADFG